MALDTQYPVSPFPDPVPCNLSCPDGPPSCLVGGFEAAILALEPSVYWPLEDTVTTSGVEDRSGNARNGVYDQTSRVTPQQGSLVPSDSEAQSVKLANVNYPTRSCAMDDNQPTWWNAAQVSVSICFSKISTEDRQTLFRRDWSVPSHRQIGCQSTALNSLRIEYAKTDNTWYSAVTDSMPYSLFNGELHIATFVLNLPQNVITGWIDGVKVMNKATTGALNQPPGPTYMAVGQSLFGSVAAFNGRLSHFVFGLRAWTEEEVETLHNAWGGEV